MSTSPSMGSSACIKALEISAIAMPQGSLSVGLFYFHDARAIKAMSDNIFGVETHMLASVRPLFKFRTTNSAFMAVLFRLSTHLVPITRLPVVSSGFADHPEGGQAVEL